MHALSLATCQMLSFPWAASFIGSAQEVASYLNSTEAVPALLEAGIGARALPCSLSQVQSVHACLESLLQLQTASVQQVVEALPATMLQQKVLLHSRLVPSLYSQASCFA